ncbi:hypothetical protein BKA65DRAFT_477942 [Rhexocercosporidium sp. MPI-PUGE-AT-0058]|nr:hypothetical protein BKA65DRAFT_477942 [Rhexocercosporidium sp. MPI-PUGE-AT-0058]
MLPDRGSRIGIFQEISIMIIAEFSIGRDTPIAGFAQADGKGTARGIKSMICTSSDAGRRRGLDERSVLDGCLINAGSLVNASSDSRAPLTRGPLMQVVVVLQTGLLAAVKARHGGGLTRASVVKPKEKANSSGTPATTECHTFTFVAPLAVSRSDTSILDWRRRNFWTEELELPEVFNGGFQHVKEAIATSHIILTLAPEP